MIKIEEKKYNLPEIQMKYLRKYYNPTKIDNVKTRNSPMNAPPKKLTYTSIL